MIPSHYFIVIFMLRHDSHLMICKIESDWKITRKFGKLLIESFWPLRQKINSGRNIRRRVINKQSYCYLPKEVKKLCKFGIFGQDLIINRLLLQPRNCDFYNNSEVPEKLIKTIKTEWQNLRITMAANEENPKPIEADNDVSLRAKFISKLT